MRRNTLSLIAGLLFFLFSHAQDANTAFPKEIITAAGQIITIYQPQPENFSGNIITGRSALSVRKSAKAEPVFGAIFYDATVDTDKDSRTALCRSVKITNVKFPGVEDKGKLDTLTKIIETEVPRWNLSISLDALVATIKVENSGTTETFNNNPPKIYYRDKPTTLILLDGDPKIQKEKDLDAERVVNTPFLIFKEGNVWNLYAGGLWYKSASVTEGWVPNKTLSKKVKSVDEQIKKEEAKNNDGKKSEEKPTVTDILVTTEPSELLQTKGAADYKSIQGTSLLYASNTTNQIFKDINTQKTYTVLAGRWYSAASLQGPWEYIASDKLPSDFAKIPEGSEKDEVLANIAGTPAAEEARIDAQIPQTAKVNRKDATIKVEYDGNPKFKKIEGTSLELAENSNVTVIKDELGKFYAVEKGVWFTSDKAKGPWKVSDERPEDVSKIPPSNEAYNTKYVYVYESTPEYVYVGYTPGYMGCYVYGPTVVYGTGYHYAPWFGSVYYPPPVTWGFGFSYNPWTGWSMNFGFSMGFMHFGFSFGGYGGWYGPPMYYPPFRPPYYGGGYYGGGNRINTGDINIGEINVGNGSGNRVDHRGGNRNNIYNNQSGVSTMDKKPGQSLGNNRGNRNPGVNNQLPSQGRQPGVNNQLPNQGGQMRQSRENNNVYADRDGNVYQRDNKGNWNERDNRNNSWNSANNNATRNNMNRESQSRDRGNMRTNNYSRQRSSMGGGGRGGGGRRR
ncbi:hypothetical protein [Flavihumibacter petaseus]|uniref:Carbohydrate-binding family V/XII n=1 Tax=Flavihumibacter petaseus NBRC 106054 TaxID=1220578 RepID=A0A0E9N461_9BACT|nr:hypothetical protein [Flavihumibacter petaseus]GAO44614.1 hypothetical protein FPE01S_03_06520 [Flavihumibacter petaseus NBRC 106054]